MYREEPILQRIALGCILLMLSPIVLICYIVMNLIKLQEYVYEQMGQSRKK